VGSGPLLLKFEKQWDGKFLRYHPTSFNKPVVGVQVRLGAWFLCFKVFLLFFITTPLPCLPISMLLVVFSEDSVGLFLLPVGFSVDPVGWTYPLRNLIWY